MSVESDLDSSTWIEYRKIKRRLVILFICFVPFAYLDVAVLPNLIGTNVPSFALVIAYAIVMAYLFFKYAFYECPECGERYNGIPMPRKKCPKCGLAIDPK